MIRQSRLGGNRVDRCQSRHDGAVLGHVRCVFWRALFVWYGLQAHQTKFLIDHGFTPNFAATALGLAAFFGIFGQIWIGALSDRVGRELAWTVALAGFRRGLDLYDPDHPIAVGFVRLRRDGHAGAVRLRHGFAVRCYHLRDFRRAAVRQHYCDTLGIGGNLGGGAGAWALGALHDIYGSYEPGLWMCWAVSIMSMVCVWIASPSRIRRVVTVARAASGERGGRRVTGDKVQQFSFGVWIMMQADNWGWRARIGHVHRRKRGGAGGGMVGHGAGRRFRPRRPDHRPNTVGRVG